MKQMEKMDVPILPMKSAFPVQISVKLDLAQVTFVRLVYATHQTLSVKHVIPQPIYVLQVSIAQLRLVHQIVTKLTTPAKITGILALQANLVVSVKGYLALMEILTVLTAQPILTMQFAIVLLQHV
jgi:hypothetical protein